MPGKSTPDPARLWRRRHKRFFDRAGLGKRIRHGAALAALTAAGDWNGFGYQASWALDERCPLTWLRELQLQSYLFVGYPRAIIALQALADCAGETGEEGFLLDRSGRREWAGRGRLLCKRIYGRNYAPLLSAMRRTHPELADWMIHEGYGKVLARPFLSPRVRELCVIPILAVQESWPQLESHLRGALNVGARRVEIREAIETGLKMVPETDKERARLLMKRALE